MDHLLSSEPDYYNGIGNNSSPPTSPNYASPKFDPDKTMVYETDDIFKDNSQWEKEFYRERASELWRKQVHAIEATKRILLSISREGLALETFIATASGLDLASEFDHEEIEHAYQELKFKDSHITLTGLDDPVISYSFISLAKSPLLDRVICRWHEYGKRRSKSDGSHLGNEHVERAAIKCVRNAIRSELELVAGILSGDISDGVRLSETRELWRLETADLRKLRLEDLANDVRNSGPTLWQFVTSIVNHGAELTRQKTFVSLSFVSMT